MNDQPETLKFVCPRCRKPYAFEVEFGCPPEASARIVGRCPDCTSGPRYDSAGFLNKIEQLRRKRLNESGSAGASGDETAGPTSPPAATSQKARVPTGQGVPKVAGDRDRQKEDAFNAVLDEVSTVNREYVASEFSGIRVQLEQAIAALHTLEKAAGLWAKNQKDLLSFKKSLPDAIIGKLVEPALAGLAEVKEQVEVQGRAVTAVVEALARKHDDLARGQAEAAAVVARQPAKVDTDDVAGPLPETLVDTEEARRQFQRLFESAVQDRLGALEGVLMGLPALFDALADPLETWEVGTKLDAKQRDVREHVVQVLAGVRRQVDSWKQAYQIEEIPEAKEEPCALDEGLHERRECVPTSDPQRRETIQRVIRLGYRWPHGRLRKARVAVWEFTGEDGNGAADSVVGPRV